MNLKFINYLTSGLVFIFLSGQLLLGQDLKIVNESKPSVDFSHGDLKVSENKRFLVHADGTPFFWLGDTAWELFHRLTKEEAETYLENRRKKGFTVIQAVALAELEGLTTPNPYGQTPLIDNDPTKPNEEYFKHVDYVIDLAHKKGMYIGLLPTWGDKIDKRWGVGPVIFNTENARKYGEWIANRYKNRENIIWINGGDRPGGGDNFPIWVAMAEGIKSVDNKHLMTFHPSGGASSAEWFHNEKWLDFNMWQTGHHERDLPTYRDITKVYSLMPIKPVLDGEPRYEDHPVNWKPEELGWHEAFDVRAAAYWGLFAGGFGHTYGAHPIWQFMDEGRKPIGHARHTWKEVIDLPGSFQMGYVRNLIQSRPMLDRLPAQDIISGDTGEGPAHIQATKGKDYAFIYLPYGGQVSVKGGSISGKTLNAWWYNPRTGEGESAGKHKNNGVLQFTSKGVKERGNDWVLVLDDASKKYSNPGLKK